jgi:hypothetical protein
MQYIITRQCAGVAKRWTIERSVDDKRSVIGHYQTRASAILAARLLAGHSGTVLVERCK